MISASPPHPVSPKLPSKTLTLLWWVTRGKFMTLVGKSQSARAASAELKLDAKMKMPSVRWCQCHPSQSWARAKFASSNTNTTPSNTAVRLRAVIAQPPPVKRSRLWDISACRSPEEPPHPREIVPALCGEQEKAIATEPPSCPEAAEEELDRTEISRSVETC